MNNVFGEKLIPCSMDPLTGYYRTGFCETDQEDQGVHAVCVVATDEFLSFSKSVGNDLTTAVPAFGFDGLQQGDRWCLCAMRWVEAYRAGKAPRVVLEATSEKMLDYVPLEILVRFAYKNQED